MKKSARKSSRATPKGHGEAHDQTLAADAPAQDGRRHAQLHCARIEGNYPSGSATLVKELIRLATKAESEAVCVAAIKEMFDRGFGKATQPVEGSLTYGISEQLAELFRGNEGNTLGAEIARRAALPPPNGQQPH